MRTRSPNLGDDSGVATLVAAFSMAALLAVAVLILHFGSVVVTRHRTQSAADLAALAVAGSLDRGSVEACRSAEPIAQRMHVRVDRCRIEDWDSVVTIGARIRLPTFGTKEVLSVARAGPVQ